jgi:hypothetical protein
MIQAKYTPILEQFNGSQIMEILLNWAEHGVSPLLLMY